MATPTRSDVGTLARTLLGDTQQSGGGIYTNDFQAPALNLAYQEMFSRLSVADADRIQREGYYVLPAYTSIFVPSLAGLNNFGWPEEIWERGIVGTYRIAAVTGSSPAAGQCSITLTDALPSSVVTGTQVQLYNVGGMSDDINDQWTITVTDTTHIILNGCVAAGTYTNSGIVAYSTEQWAGPLDPRDDTDGFPTGTNSALGMYNWAKSVLRFPVCSTQRELKLEYNLSASLSTTTPTSGSDSMGIDDCLSFLANRTAQYCAQSKIPAKVPMLQQQADYFLGLMLSGAGRAMQADEPIVMAPFRPARNVRYPIW